MEASDSLLATQLPLLTDLTAAIDSWSTCQRQVVGLAADFADSGEWGATGVSSAAHWIAKAADIELCTAREWIRVGKKLRGLPSIADAFEQGGVSYVAAERLWARRGGHLNVLAQPAKRTCVRGPTPEVGNPPHSRTCGGQ